MKRFFTAGMTDTGLIRSVNQDAYHIDPEERFFIVADGMGGHAGGQEASRLAIETMQAFLTQQWDTDLDSATLLRQAVLEANQAILKDQRLYPERADMGTTAVAVIFRDEDPLYTHIGDSRLYRLRGAKLDQITEDHTWVARAMRLGELTPDQARVHPMRHVLAQCLGRPELEFVEIQSLSVQPGDRLLLCSDGLTEELSDQLIATHLKTIRACEKAATALINAAKDRGGRDNITVIIVAVP
ncbi:MAG: protein phosphatase 2C domain-containing protein [Leptolyngbya sp. Prado105]|jgi:protein phosphatase|nr:protein phosphatase 2C domain-containing protein [Leptolyngbya sp. Prado105]